MVKIILSSLNIFIVKNKFYTNLNIEVFTVREKCIVPIETKVNLLPSHRPEGYFAIILTKIKFCPGAYQNACYQW